MSAGAHWLFRTTITRCCVSSCVAALSESEKVERGNNFSGFLTEKRGDRESAQEPNPITEVNNRLYHLLQPPSGDLYPQKVRYRVAVSVVED